MNMQLFTQINTYNKILNLINAKQAKIAKFFDKKDVVSTKKDTSLHLNPHSLPNANQNYMFQN